jgi:Tetracyclin repressor-like, C-terminal domain
MCVIRGRWRGLPSGAPARKKRSATCGGDRGSRALTSLGHRCRVSDVDWGANRAWVHYSAVRRYFSSHDVLPAEGWTRGSSRVCAALLEPGPMSPSRVAEKLANGLVAGTLLCGLLANLRLHLKHAVDLDRVVEIRRTSAAAEMSLADAIGQELPVLGRSDARNVLLAACSLAGLIKHQPVDTRLLLNRPDGKS